MWTYPRPPALEATTRRVRVELAGVAVAAVALVARAAEPSGAAARAPRARLAAALAP